MVVKLFAALCLALALLWSPENASAQDLKTVVVERKVVVVRGDQVWTDTGIDIRSDTRMRIKFEASGKVCFNPDKDGSCIGPTGWPLHNYDLAWPMDSAQCTDPLFYHNHAALIGRVGPDIFFIGQVGSLLCGDGRLYLGVNDCTHNGRFSNSGQFMVEIIVEKDVAATAQE